MAVNEHNARPEDADVRIARLYREAAHELPPGHLDNTIAAAARKAAGAPERKPAFWWFKPLHVPLAAVAIGIVAWSLIALMMREDPERAVSPPLASAPSPGADRVPGESTPDPMPPIDLRKRAAPITRDVPSGDARTIKVPDGVTEAPLQALRKEERARMAASAPRAREQLARSGDRATAAPPPPLVAAEPKGSAEAQDGPAPAPAKSLPTPSGDSAVRSPPPPLAAAVPPGTPTPRAEMRMERRSTQPLAALTAPDVSPHLVELEYRPPADWLDRMRLLRRDGRLAEADRLLAEFRRRYPNEFVPSDLQ
jgi:hypothetical protein